MWDEFCNFDIEIESNSDTIINSNDRLRHDNINNGFVSLKSSKDLYCINAHMGLSDKEKDNYDVFLSQNNRVYLTQCLTFAHANSGYFQHEMSKYFDNDKNCQYCKASVKTYDRCLIKSSTEYSDELYLNTTCILDFCVAVNDSTDFLCDCISSKRKHKRHNQSFFSVLVCLVFFFYGCCAFV